jgi:uncharacterized protein (DUF305 family)
MLPTSDKRSWFGIGAFLLLGGIGIPIWTVAWPGGAPKFAGTIIRICSAPFHPAAPEQTSFFARNSAAMSRMMIGMAIEPSGDVDPDFVAMMVPHHQGAIDVAQAELQYGHNEQLRRIAPEIVVEQLQEIAAMRLAIGEHASPTWMTNKAHEAPAGPSPVKTTPANDAAFVIRSNTAMDAMMTDMAVTPTGNVDHDFVAIMVPHHQGAIDMAQAELQYGQNPLLKTAAQEIIVDQLQEITLMRLALGQPPPQSVPSPTQAPSDAMQTSPANESDNDGPQTRMPPGMHMAPIGPVGAR